MVGRDCESSNRDSPDFFNASLLRFPPTLVGGSSSPPLAYCAKGMISLEKATDPLAGKAYGSYGVTE